MVKNCFQSHVNVRKYYFLHVKCEKMLFTLELLLFFVFFDLKIFICVRYCWPESQFKAYFY